MLYSPKIYGDWDLPSNFQYYKKIEILIDRFVYELVPDDTIRIIVIQEPKCIEWLTNVVNKHKDFYTYVFTYNQNLLETNDKAVLFLCIKTWINNYEFPLKKFGISTLVGGKTHPDLEGYELRHKLWDRKLEINTPRDFYLSSHYPYQFGNYKKNKVLGDDKSVMFDNQYHIAIENKLIINAFSEKLIDCFQTKTIPIHYGCPNIGNFFNLDGILVVNNIDEIINICNSLTPEYYESKINAIEDNYYRSMKYVSQTEILDRTLNELLNK